MLLIREVGVSKLDPRDFDVVGGEKREQIPGRPVLVSKQVLDAVPYMSLNER